MKFHSGAGGVGVKRVAEEEIIEVEDLGAKQPKSSKESEKRSGQLSIGSFKKPVGLGQKFSLANLVKRKTTSASSISSSSFGTSTDATNTETNVNKPTNSVSSSQPAPSKPNALSLLSGYDNTSDSDGSE